MTRIPPATIKQLRQLLHENGSSNRLELVEQAFQFVKSGHGDRRRQSGELYWQHDLEVAFLVAQLGVDVSTIAAAMLHDILLPHTERRLDDVRTKFGEDVESLVAALDKLAPYTDKHDDQRGDKTLERIRRAILTIVDGDARVIVIHLADRLVDLRSAKGLPVEVRRRLAKEARDIHAPLANRLGIWQLKWEIEDRAFSYLETKQFDRIAQQIAERRPERTERIDQAVAKLNERITAAGIEAEVSGRPKHIYSIFRKMRDKGLNFEQIYDIRALRVIVEESDPSLCYQALGIVHNLWQPIPHEFDDYIARPKSNGYQSLHTAVIDERGQNLEVQIRTRAMHEEAERGIAAHWAYKEGGRGGDAFSQHVNWLRQLISSLREEDGADPDDEVLKGEILGERIYVFTPQGDVIDLPTGATPIDFAYAIHTEVGHRCRGARVNGKMVSLDYQLRSGEKVEVITASKGGPSRDWMNESLGYAASARTRSKVRSWFRQQERDKNIAQGRDVVNRELKRLGVTDVYTIQDIAQALKFDDAEQFLAKVGFGDIQSAQIGGAIAALQQKLKPDDELRQLLERTQKKTGKQPTVRGLSGLHTKMAKCCNPIPPEPIMGYITRGRGVTIHTEHCKQLLATREPERWIEVEWGADEDTYPIPIVIRAYRRPGLMDDIANLLTGANIALSKTKTVNEDGIATIFMVAEVSSLDQLNWILGRFEKLNNVIEARRQRWSG
ncbi:MAG: bifunctional (p)ppGpp synthetase/guanosine-3',5'-bis(diphosphate) 3'-pyrophosphohydrolase [Candidatus Promineifilaceae bacterium]|nr:bifunctional (p)ppGpp synthetase/guanosine-3',5'-bis(diphosphate) 3'-pyrophosphohydrolase [Candidatus Promineifilaceae bacterium]